MNTRKPLAAVLPLMLAMAACGDPATVDGGVDGGPRDGGPRVDSGPGADLGPAGDAGPPRDAGPPPDFGPAGPDPTIAGCRIFPSDNPWNQDVTTLPRHPREAQLMANMNPSRSLHADWGNVTPDHYGIPYTFGTGAPPLPMTWTETWGSDESDPLACPTGGGRFCYPIPSTAPIEGGPAAAVDSDRHVLYLDTAGAPDNCTLYELFNAQNFTGPGWTAIGGAIFHLGTNTLRNEGWTSADAAGLPILPGLVRIDEVLAGRIEHAVRFTMATTAREYIHPATHAAGDVGTDLPPMGLRLRLRADFPVASAPANTWNPLAATAGAMSTSSSPKRRSGRSMP